MNHKKSDKKLSNIKALSFDLDDTLYNNVPVINNAFHELYQYLLNHYPDIKYHYSFDNFLSAAQNLKHHHDLTHDLSQLRRLHIEQVLQHSGYQQFELEQAFHVFWHARQQVELYPGVIKVLNELSKQLPLISISNGNACPKTIGISKYFQFSLSVSEKYRAKPDNSMFFHACDKLQILPEQLLHIGDNLEKDVAGANSAGCRSIWFNQTKLSGRNHHADAVIEELSELLLFNFL